METMDKVIDEGLCTGCGTCAGVCPSEAVKMQVAQELYLPEIKYQECSRCGLCIKVCPGHSVNFELLNLEIFGRQPEDSLLGNYIKCYIGHSNDYSIRYGCSSGGIATQLLVFALEENLIDGALVTRMKKDNPLEPESFIARTKEEIISASKSKYCPVSANEALKQILKEDGRFAVIGLPCHIHGVRKAEEAIEKLKKRIVLHVGLMCSHTVSFAGTEFLLKKLNIKKDHVVKLDYRGEGWPGSMSIQTKEGKNLKIPLIGSWNAYWPIFSSFFFTPLRCIMCPDETNELSDISLGDAWLPELKNEKVGESIIVTRTKTAEKIIDIMNSSGLISVRSVNFEKIILSQVSNLQFKKNDFSSRLLFLNWVGKKKPVFCPQPSELGSMMPFLRALFSYLNIQTSSNKHIRSLLSRIPLPFFRLYYGLYKFSVKNSRCTFASF